MTSRRSPDEGGMDSSPTLMALLQSARDGDPNALGQVATALYGQLHRLARQHLRANRPGQSLRTTDLVHEAYLKLAHLKEPEWRDRVHFLSQASRAMRSLLVDYARRRTSAKRGKDPTRISLEDVQFVSEQPSTEVLSVDQALQRLSELDPRKGRIMELRYFGGLSIEETAEVVGISTGTVKREWNKAGAWLRRELRRGNRA